MKGEIMNNEKTSQARSVSCWLSGADIDKLDKIAKARKWTRSQLLIEFTRHCLSRGVFKSNAQCDPTTQP